MTIRRTREIHHIAFSEITDGNRPVAQVITYAVRKSGSTWVYRTAVVGHRGEEHRGWLQNWDSWDQAVLMHGQVCSTIAGGGAVSYDLDKLKAPQ